MNTYYPATRPVRSSTYSFEPVTPDELKRQLRLSLDVSHHDELLNDLIKEAREQVERDSSVVGCTGTYVFKKTRWAMGRDWFEIPDLKPVTSITSITYVDSAGTVQTWSTSEYSLDTYGVAPFVRLGYGYSWPTIRGDINGITVTVAAGYATADVIPQRYKQAVLLLAGHRFNHPELVGGASTGQEVPKAYDWIIEGLRRSVYS